MNKKDLENTLKETKVNQKVKVIKTKTSFQKRLLNKPGIIRAYYPEFNHANVEIEGRYYYLPIEILEVVL